MTTQEKIVDVLDDMKDASFDGYFAGAKSHGICNGCGLQKENKTLAKRILELQGDISRLKDEVDDWKAKADKAFCEKANAEIKFDEAKQKLKEFIELCQNPTWFLSKPKIIEEAVAFLEKDR